ncbi:flagellar assembly protein FliH [Cohnella suwonensis]|uniref:Flagellar assembly protein FliH n=1 Tax=Cohnella suwonensis TaxID=696072 RepID=A0ABW0M2J4_9BACL
MSNLIKSSHVVSLEELRLLEAIRKYESVPRNNSKADGEGEGNGSIDVETQSLKERVISDAEATAAEILRQAQADAANIRANAEREADGWWQARRGEDAEHREEASRLGYEDGYGEGRRKAEQDVASEWDSRLSQAHSIVERAYEAKQSVIAEGEAFLVELSCRIAEKIVGSKLSDAPEMAMSLYEKALARRKEQGVIVLCVAPSHFPFVQAAKSELANSLDSQAELRIVPDPSVREGGCVVRSAFGSIDATIDTQLESIREQLLKVAAHSAEEGSRDVAP